MAKEGVRKSLLWRLFLTFSGCVMLLWLAVILWLVISAFSEGKRVMRAELDVFSRQIIPLIDELRDKPGAIRRVLGNLERLEATLEGSDPEDYFIDVRLNDELIYSGAESFTAPPLKQGYQEFSAGGSDWWSYTNADASGTILVRLAAQAFSSAELSLPDQFAAFFLPLVVSLPLLLIPAWLMARFALRPLQDTAALISTRMASGSLDTLPNTPYVELNSVVLALNRLLERLSAQLERERSLVAEVAHELKTPLAIVQTNQSILVRSSDEERRRVALEDLGAGVERCNHLVQQLLGLARLERELDPMGLRRTVDLAEFVRLRLAHAEALATKRAVSLDLHAPDALPLALDVDAFAAALDNLLDNAIKYSPGGGSVRVVLEVCDESREIRLQIADGGPGIAPQDRDRAFTRFERLQVGDLEGLA